MQTTILKEKLKNGISIVERVAGKSFNLPILNNILISTYKNFLNLTATDLEVGINWWALVKTNKEGKITIPAKIFSSFISFLPNKPVNLTVEDLNLKINSENYQTSIKGTSAEDFPIIPKVSKEEYISLNCQQFCKSLNKVVDIASFSSTKPEISGVYFLFQKNLITMAATDSFRLGEKKLKPEESSVNISKDFSLILPQKTAKEIISIFGEKEGNLTVYFGENQILFETLLSETPHPEIQVTSRLIEGEYPNYQEIVPKKSETQIAFPLQEFINQVKIASLFSGKISDVKLKVDPEKGGVDISANNPEVGEHQSFVQAKIEGQGCEIAFNYRFLLDGLLKINSVSGQQKNPEAILELAGPEKPGVIKPKEGADFFYLIMPIKTS